MQGEGPAELGVQGPAWRDAILGFHALNLPAHLSTCPRGALTSWAQGKHPRGRRRSWQPPSFLVYRLTALGSHAALPRPGSSHFSSASSFFHLESTGLGWEGFAPLLPAPGFSRVGGGGGCDGRAAGGSLP